jgi:glucose/arabinose dehydrogenase
MIGKILRHLALPLRTPGRSAGTLSFSQLRCRTQFERLEERALLTALPAGFAATHIVQDLPAATSMALAPVDQLGNHRLFIAEQGGPIRVVENDQLLADPFVTIPDVLTTVDAGVLGIAIDPSFNSNGYVYVHYTTTEAPVRNRIIRYTASADGTVALPGSETIIFELDPIDVDRRLLGGAIQFGQDGKLYISTGDNQTDRGAQSIETLHGKILRINPDGSIPIDNPYYASAEGSNRAIWAIGLRNPFTFAIQPQTGRMLINDVGEKSWEEINEGQPGANFGWPDTEGPHSNPQLANPVYAYPHADGACAVTGGVFYTPNKGQFPATFIDQYLFSDFCAGWIKTLDPQTLEIEDFATGAGRVIDLDVDSHGALYVLAFSDGAVIVNKIEFLGTSGPTISANPQDQIVSVGSLASFTVSATGEQPLSYQWQVNGESIPGATSAEFSIGAASLQQNGDLYSVVVSNQHGHVQSSEAVLQVTTDLAPVPLITLPSPSAFYAAGDTITFAGQATDPETGYLPDSALTWRVDFHHDDHIHPVLPPRSGISIDSFTVPLVGETSPHVWYRIHLSATDPAGLTTSTHLDVHPRTSSFTLDSVPTGMELRLDAQPITGPLTVEGIIGLKRTLEAPRYQVADEQFYRFGGWSDGQPPTHAISTPSVDSTFTASYRVFPGLDVGFDNGDAAFFRPQLGNWSLLGDRYTVAPFPQGDSVAVVNADVMLPEQVRLGVTLRTLISAPSQNGLLVFDYHGPTNFKYVGAASKANLWIIGERTSAGWNSVRSLAEEIEPNVDYHVHSLIDGSTVELVVDGVFKISHDFGQLMNDGQVGLATANATTEFDEFFIRFEGAFPTTASLPLTESFAGPVDYLFEELGRWSIEQGAYQAQPENGHALSLISVNQLLPDVFAFAATLHTQSVPGFSNNALLVFDYHSNTNYKFAGIAAGSDHAVIGVREGDEIVVAARTATVLNPNEDYAVALFIDGSRAALHVGGVERVAHDFGTPLKLGSLGLATVNGFAQFDNLHLSQPAEMLQFDPDAGDWTSKTGRLFADPAIGGVASQVLDAGFALPSQMEIKVVMNAARATPGRASNALVLFDYIDAGNFKFAGAATAGGRWVIGERIHGGVVLYAVLQNLSAPDTDYEVAVHTEGSVARLTVDGTALLSHDFGKPLGVGTVGVGTINSRASFSRIAIGENIPAVTSALAYSEDFSSGAPSADVSTGAWFVRQGRFEASSIASGDAVARLQLGDLPASFSIEAKVEAPWSLSSSHFRNALIVFDYRSADDFKFAGLAVVLGTGRWVIGHRSGLNTLINDSAFDPSVGLGTSRRIRVELEGSLARLLVEGELKVSTSFARSLNLGQIGLGSISDFARFDDIQVQ